ncbi:MAG TPA: ATP-binding cassette domain-containing protein, partial [Micromonosporaceae bacterium]
TVCGHDVLTQGYQVRQAIGLTGQYAAVDDQLTGRDNLVMLGRLLGLSRPDARRRATSLLESFDLATVGHRAVKTYSGGMRRRLDLASSLVGRPRVLFLDEPTTGLDPRSRGELWAMVRELVADGTTVALTTQYLDEADQLADHIVLIDHGRVIAEGGPAELKMKVAGQYLAVRPADPAEVARATAILTDCVRATPRLDGGQLVVALPDRAAMPVVVRRLDDAGVCVAELSLRSATLDEVFLTLTGGSASADDRAPT